MMGLPPPDTGGCKPKLLVTSPAAIITIKSVTKHPCINHTWGNVYKKMVSHSGRRIAVPGCQRDQKRNQWAACKYLLNGKMS